ncbi:radical SAM protein [Dickeya sp. CFBP 2040]|uniref:Radical SAM protein n=1 Tax=Dickeya poaceiphila TaxID=568768 RepID=A0A5B8I418_9GAMM|nr:MULTISPECIES: radical SAM protein [Dickeya]NKI73150.1 radical SAM protein [Dickeya sp. CFBP 2040]QDX29353.1 radical SAM protein [Dickeya poaceiphila]
MSSSDHKVLNTPMYYFEGDDGLIYSHLPLRGIAFKSRKTSLPVLEKLANHQELSIEDQRHPIIKKLSDWNVIGEHVKELPVIDDLEEFKPFEATLLLTETCNLACSYCYARATGEKSEAMSKAIAKKAVDTAIENAKSISSRTAEFRYLGGGEPTTEWELIVWINNYIKYKADEAGVNTYIRLITNGVLINDEKAKWLKNNVDFVTLSFDVLPDLQLNRSFPNGKSSQKAVLRTSDLLTKYGVPYHFRTTLSSESTGRLVEMVEYIIANTSAKEVRMEPMAEIGRATDSELSKPKQQEFIDQFKKAYFLGKENGINVTNKLIRNVDRRGGRFCNVEFAVTPKGEVAGCHRYSRSENEGYDLFHVGRFSNDNFKFDINKINALRQINNTSFSDCSQCFARWSCASGCLSARYDKNGIAEHGPICHITRELLKFGVQQSLAE